MSRLGRPHSCVGTKGRLRSFVGEGGSVPQRACTAALFDPSRLPSVLLNPSLGLLRVSSTPLGPLRPHSCFFDSLRRFASSLPPRSAPFGPARPFPAPLQPLSSLPAFSRLFPPPLDSLRSPSNPARLYSSLPACPRLLSARPWPRAGIRRPVPAARRGWRFPACTRACPRWTSNGGSGQQRGTGTSPECWSCWSGAGSPARPTWQGTRRCTMPAATGTWGSAACCCSAGPAVMPTPLVVPPLCTVPATAATSPSLSSCSPTVLIRLPPTRMVAPACTRRLSKATGSCVPCSCSTAQRWPLPAMPRDSVPETWPTLH